MNILPKYVCPSTTNSAIKWPCKAFSDPMKNKTTQKQKQNKAAHSVNSLWLNVFNVLNMNQVSYVGPCLLVKKNVIVVLSDY